MTETLFEKYCLGTLAPDETRDLKRGLATNAETRRAMARYLQERSILVQLAGRTPRRRAVVRPPRRAPRAWIPVAVACAFAAAMLLPAQPAERRTSRVERPVVVVTEPSPAPEPRAPAPVVPPPAKPLPPPVTQRPEPAPEIRPQPPIEEPRPAPRWTVAAVAVVEQAADATMNAGQDVLPGSAISTGSKGSAVLRYPDGTRVELGSATTLKDVESSRLVLTAGTIRAEVAKRPADRPLVVKTPQGDATVLGTIFKLVVGSSTRLDVMEGKVRLTRAVDGKFVDVGADQYASVETLVARSKVLHAEEFDRLPAWSSSYHAVWGASGGWSSGAGQKGNGLQATRTARGSSVVAIVYRVPAGETIDLSVFMRCPKLQGRSWMEFGVRLGEHRASDFDTTADKWTVVQKFHGTAGQDGNGGAWTRHSAQVQTGNATRITVAFKVGSNDGALPTVGFDGLMIRIP